MSGTAAAPSGQPAAQGSNPAVPARRLLVGLAWVPVLLAIVAEGAWISIVAGLVQEFALRAPVVGLLPMTAFAGLGVAAGRLIAPRAGTAWPVAAVGLVGVAAIAGWLMSADARAALAGGDMAGAFAANPGGLAAGLGVLRGFAHAGEHLAGGTVGRMVFTGIPALGILAAIGGMIAEPFRGQFLGATAISAAVFVATGLLALAFAGVAEVERSRAPTWRGNPAWVALLLAAVALLVASAVPVSLAAGPAIATMIQLVIGIAIVPLVVAGLLASGGAGLRRILGFTVAGVAIVGILSLAQPGGPLEGLIGSPGSGAAGGRRPDDSAGLIGVTALVLGLVAIGIVILARAWRRRRPRADGSELEDERSFELPEGEPGVAPTARRRRRRLGLGPAPATAAEAYLRLLDDVAGRPRAGRAEGETPTEHARRLRLTRGAGGNLSLELLAADYSLATFGGVAISPAETRRAIARWRWLRGHLGRADMGEAVGAEAEGDEGFRELPTSAARLGPGGLGLPIGLVSDRDSLVTDRDDEEPGPTR